MDQVPDLRAFGARLVQCVVSLVFGMGCGWRVALVLPHGHVRAGSQLAPVFLIIAMGAGFAIAWYALFEGIRRARRPRSSAVPTAIVHRR